jgi:O-antigen/teichoic acid export membrane protein
VAFPIFKRAVPVLAVFVVGLLIYNLDIIFLRFMRSTEVVGFYAAAYSLIGLLVNVCTAYGFTLLPSLSRLVEHPVEEQYVYHTAMAQVFALTLPISVGAMFVAGSAILLGFGADYGPSGPILQLLIWTVPIYAFRVVSWAGLVAHGLQGLALRAVVYGVFANTILNLILIHFYGMTGAAIASIATEVLATALTLNYAAKTGLTIAPFGRFWRPAIAVLAMSVSLRFMGDAPLIFQFVAGVGTYMLALLIVGGIKIQGRVPALAV